MTIREADPGALDVLVLADTSVRFINTINDHLNSLIKFSRNNVVVLDYRAFNRTWNPPVSFDRFDVVIVHYSIVVADRGQLSKVFRQRLRDYPGLKVIFIQDEYRWIDETAFAVEQCKFDVLFSVVNEQVVERIYSHPGLASVRKETTLTGFVPEQLLSRTAPAYEDRKTDVGYRARRVPTWLGASAHEKWLIGQKFLTATKTSGLVCDIESDERKRLYGDAWVDFLANCKAVLGTESGASVCDFDGSIQKQVEAYEKSNPEASFDVVRDKFFARVDGQVLINVISPRCFEAAALRTLMILYPGDYSGRLEPWKHYVPLERDFSNLHEIIAIIRDPVRATVITERAYKEVACDPRNTFQAFVSHFDRVVADEMPARNFIRKVRTPDLEIMRAHGKRREFYLRLKRPIVAAGLNLVSAAIELLVPKQLRPRVVRMARSLWRRMNGMS